MADTVSPVTCATVDYKATLPKPDQPHSGGDPERVDSLSTLRGDEEEPGKIDTRVGDEQPNKNETVSASRPSLTVPRLQTDASRPVGPRPSTSLRQLRSAGGYPTDRRSWESTTSSTSWVDDSSDEDEVSTELQRWHTHPHYVPLSTSRAGMRKGHHVDGRLHVGNEHFQSRGKIAKDGRLDILVNETANSGYLAKTLGATIERNLLPYAQQAAEDAERSKVEFLKAKPTLQIPRMNIVIMVIGSRGDIQPFLKIGKILQDKYHHRVRIATHPVFRQFVQDDVGLEFFSIGGDPSELMAFMVKNHGLIPSLGTIKEGEIRRRRESMFEMFQGFWRACINATDDESETANQTTTAGSSAQPFVADAIIANPPSFAHYHCAERLGIPLHLIFTFPYSPTQSFPHPLTNIRATNVDPRYTNFMSYPLIDLMIWQGLGDLVNRFRVLTLGLEPVSTLWAPGQLWRSKVPTTYLWSPGLVPKPPDWGPEIDLAGYVFLELASSYNPPPDLVQFLKRTDERPVIYIGFGSISGVDDPLALTRMVFEAVDKAGVRAVVHRGWGKMGDGIDTPDSVFLVGNVPHDWLFPQVDAVVHHGGAGTTAAGLRFGKPTMVVPFFGDQPFWGAMVAKAGAGARQALPLKKLNSDKFAQGIRQCLEPEAREKAEQIARGIEKEGDGAENAVDSFHRVLLLEDPHSMRCGIFPDRLAVWHVRGTSIELSALATELLVENKLLSWTDLSLKRHREWADFHGPGEPLTGAGGVVVAAFQEAFHGLSSIPGTTKKSFKEREIRRRRKKEKTVADTRVSPGPVASRQIEANQPHQEQERQRHRRHSDGLNFYGEAEPPKFPFARPGDDDAMPPRPRNRRTSTSSSDLPSAPVVVMKDVGRGIGHSTRAIMTLPLEVSNALALGFRNAPRLYGDVTVREPPHTIKSFRTGVKVAGREFCLGFYDGVVGLVRIPRHEVLEKGVAGLPKGIARAIGGLLLKPMSGILGLGAYTGKGLQASVRKHYRDSQKIDRWIRHARIVQGQMDVKKLQKRSKVESPASPGAAEPGDLDEVLSTALTQWILHKDVLAQARGRQHQRKQTDPEK